MNTILRLFYDLSIYKEILSQSFLKTFGRFLLGYCLISLGYSLYLHYQQAPQIIDDIQATISTVNSTLPDEATLSLNDYQLSTQNLPLPYNINNILSINPATDSAALASSSAAITLGATHLRLMTTQNTYEVRSYQEEGFTPFDLNGKDVKIFLTKLSGDITTISPYLPLIIFLPIFLGLTIFRFIYAAFYSLIFYLITIVFGGKYKLAEFLAVSLHTIIVADIINLAVLVIYGPGYSVVFSLAFVGVTILAYFNLPLRIPKKIG